MRVHGNMLQVSPPPAVTLNDGWEKLAALLKHLEDGLFGGGLDNPSAFTPTDFEEAHSLAYELCTPSLCGDVFRRLGIHFADVAQRAVANRKEYNAATYMRRMSQIFSYINQTYVSRRALPSVAEVINDAFFHARMARDVGPAIQKLALTTGALGDEGEPILLDEEGGGGSGGGGGAGPSSGDPNLRPPTPDDPEDSDFEELTRDQFRANVAGPRINELVAPGLVVKKVVHNGNVMNGVVAMRDFKRCEPIGIYSGAVLTSAEYNSTKAPLAKAYAFEMSSVQVQDTDLRLIIVPTLLPDGSGVDFQKFPLAALDEPDPGTTANCYVQQVQVPRDAMKGPGPSNALEPYICLACATRPSNATARLVARQLTPPLRPLPQRFHDSENHHRRGAHDS